MTLTFSLASQIAEVETEIRKRREVYDRLVNLGKMSPSQANYKIEAMTAVRDTLHKLRQSAPQ
jgi:hypothetical protein